MRFDVRKDLIVEVNDEVFEKVFDKNYVALMCEVEMIIEYIEFDGLKYIEFKKNDENFEVYVNGERFKFDF